MPDTSGVAVLMLTSEWNRLQQQFTLYQTSAVLLFFALIGILYLFNKAFPFVWARFVTHGPVVGILNANTHVIELRSDFKKSDGKYYYKNRRLDYVKVYPGSYFFAGYPFDLLDIDLRDFENPKYWKACETLKQMGYPDIDSLERALLFSMMDKSDPRINEIIEKGDYEDYEDASSVINPYNITMHSAVIPMFFTTTTLSTLIGYGSEIPPEDITGEVDDTYEARKPQNALNKKMMKVAPLCVIIVGVAIFAALAYKIFFAA